MTLYFITGNKNKFGEAKQIIPELEQLDIDLPEVQEIDSKKIIEAKLLEAFNHKNSSFIVEDTSLHFDCLNGLPGPLIKWFMKKIGNEGLFEIAKKFGNFNCQARTIVGYGKSPGKIYFFEGIVKGKIVEPKAETNFGWDPLFQVEGYDKSFAYMSKEEKNKISMRRIAFDKLKKFLENN